MSDDSTDAKRGVGFWCFVVWLGLVAGYLLATPIFPDIAMRTMRRFHLAENNFAVWAAQFPVPAMYNFSNRWRVGEGPLDPESIGPATHSIGFATHVTAVDLTADPRDELPTGIIPMDRWRHANHFPARVVTFADGRYQHLFRHQTRHFFLHSSYRGNELRTRFALEPAEGHGYRMWRVTR